MITTNNPGHLNMQIQIIASRYSADKRTEIFTLRLTEKTQDSATGMEAQTNRAGSNAADAHAIEGDSWPDLFFALWNHPEPHAQEPD